MIVRTHCTRMYKRCTHNKRNAFIYTLTPYIFNTRPAVCYTIPPCIRIIRSGVCVCVCINMSKCLLLRQEGPAVDGLGFCVHVAPIIDPGNRFSMCVCACGVIADKERSHCSVLRRKSSSRAKRKSAQNLYCDDISRRSYAYLGSLNVLQKIGFWNLIFIFIHD